MINKVLHGDCLEKLKDLADNSVDAVVTDPPYGLSFMGKKWDYDVPSEDIWRECLRVLKPGGYLLAFAGTRTQHRMAVRIEDAGFEIRDMIAWVYGSGFPKSLNIGKAIDALQGNEREDLGVSNNGSGASSIKLENHEKGDTGIGYMDGSGKNFNITKGNSEWEGWGTALKPALEPITVARKPLSEKTVAFNVLKWGTGGIDIDGSRVETLDEISNHSRSEESSISKGKYGDSSLQETHQTEGQKLGRFPANFLHDGSDEVVAMFPNTKSGAMKKAYVYQNNGNSLGAPSGSTKQIHESSEGNASRFFYCAKASKSERNAGCEDMTETRHADRNTDGGVGGDNPRNRSNTSKKNFHPTVKPIALMEYLVKLVSKENAIILDPFGGSGSTAVACKNTNRNYILIEREEDYIPIINARIENSKPKVIPLTLF
jgi:DNA modification methylase